MVLSTKTLEKPTRRSESRGPSRSRRAQRRETTPMLPYTFAFIVRGALTRWWAETRVRAPV